MSFIQLGRSRKRWHDLEIGKQVVMAFKFAGFICLSLTLKGRVHVFLSEGWLFRVEWTWVVDAIQRS